jgi:membrane-bound metal-dependent hydrolase YbcI (DUF457 family)
MPLPIGHALAGASAAAAASWNLPGLQSRRLTIAGAVIAVLPDLDYLLSWTHFLGRRWHHGFTHSIVFALLLGAAAAKATRVPGWRAALACCAATLSHPLLDYLLTESGGLQLLWPFTDARFKLGIEGLNYYASDAHGPVAGILLTSRIEVLIFGPLLALTLWLRARRRRGPQGGDSSGLP